MNPSSSSDEEACSFAMQLINESVLVSALKSAIELDLLELTNKTGPAASVSPSELAAQIPATNPAVPAMLDRILRHLAANNILDCSLRKLPDGGVERLYSLPSISKFLTRNDDGVSLAPLFLMSQDKINTET